MNRWDYFFSFTIGYHCSVRFQFWTIVPNIKSGIRINCLRGKKVSTEQTCSNACKSESQTSFSCWLNIWEVMNPSLIRYNRNSTSISSSTATYKYGKRIGQNWTNHHVYVECPFVLSVKHNLVFPWNTFGSSHVFLKSEGDPRITANILFQEVHILVLFCFGWITRRSYFKYFISFPHHLIFLSVLFTIIFQFREEGLVCVIVLTGHIYYPFYKIDYN